MQRLMRTEQLQNTTVCLYRPCALALSTWANRNTLSPLTDCIYCLEPAEVSRALYYLMSCLRLQLVQKHHQSLVLWKSQRSRNTLLKWKDTFSFIRFWMFFPKNRTLHKTTRPQETNTALRIRQLASSCPQVVWHTLTTSVSRLAWTRSMNMDQNRV